MHPGSLGAATDGLAQPVVRITQEAVVKFMRRPGDLEATDVHRGGGTPSDQEEGSHPQR